VKYYLASLPEPLTTLELYNEIRGARSSIYSMRNILKRLSSVNYMTLEFITALLLRVSQKSLLNKVENLPSNPILDILKRGFFIFLFFYSLINNNLLFFVIGAPCCTIYLHFFINILFVW